MPFAEPTGHRADPLEWVAKTTSLRAADYLHGSPRLLNGWRAQSGRPYLGTPDRPAIRAVSFGPLGISICNSRPAVWNSNMTSNDLERMSIEELWALHVEISNVLSGKIATEKR